MYCEIEQFQLSYIQNIMEIPKHKLLEFVCNKQKEEICFLNQNEC